MKKIINILSILFLIAFAMPGCEKDTEYKSGAGNAVTTLTEPVADYAINLMNSPEATLMFEWEAVSGNPLYTLMFYSDAEGKDLIYSTLSGGDGLKALLDVKHDLLAEVAETAGIKAGKVGDIYWNVTTNKGTNKQLSDVHRKLTIKRLKAIADIPVSLYLTGSASEGGDDVAQAIVMKKTSDTQFEVYTELKAGEYKFINRNVEGDMRTFGFDEEGMLAETDNSITIEAADASIYRIGVNFASIDEVEITKISKVEYYYPANTGANKPLVYEGRGIWKVAEIVVPDGDNRYHFRATTDKGVEWWGHETRNVENPPTDLAGSYNNIFINAPQSDDYHFVYKYMDALKGATVGFIVEMSDQKHTHVIDAGEMTLPQIKSLDTPVNNLALTLEKSATAKVDFKWIAGTNSGPKPMYKVVFFKDAAGKDQIAEVAAQGFNTNVEITHSRLDEIAGLAGIPSPLGKGNLYWAVHTTVINISETSTLINKLAITRREGVPKTLEILGSGTEYAADGKAMKALGDGKFEIYTKLTAGSYSFVDNNDMKYYIDGSTIKPGSDTPTAPAGIYKITMDFSENSAKMEQITKVEFSVMKVSQYELAYDKDGVWKAVFIPNFNEPWGDDRYYYLVTIGGKVVKYSRVDENGFGSSTNDVIPEGDEKMWVYSDKDPNNNGQYDWSFKIKNSYRNNTTKSITAILNLSSTNTVAKGNYYNHIIYP